MAYDKAKAHEYYENYTKKGKLKGRQKGKSKKKSTKAKTIKLVGLSSAGLNDAGKMEFALMKEKLQDEMNAAMKNASSQAEKDAIRLVYQQRALQEITNIKNNPSFAKPKTSKKSKKTSESGENTENTGSDKTISDIKNAVSELNNVLDKMSDEQKSLTKEIANFLINKLSERSGEEVEGVVTSLEELREKVKKTKN